ncbi:invasion associated locus B family protein [Hoeflea sp. CAU 1731]
MHPLKSKVRSVLLFTAVALMTWGAAQPIHAQERAQKNFEKWIVACVKPNEGQNRCTLMQNFEGLNKTTNQRFFAFALSIVPDPAGGEKVQLRTPLGVKLAERVVLQFPGADPLAIDYTVCSNIGCFAEFKFQDIWKNMLAQNATAKIRYVLMNDREITIDVALPGFSEGYAYLHEAM